MPSYADPSNTRSFDLSGNAFIDSLYDDVSFFRVAWNTVVNGKTAVTYSFPWANGVTSQFYDGYGNGENTATTTGAITSTEAPGVADAFQAWANVANLTFSRVDETAGGQVGDIRIAFSSLIDSGFWGYTLINSDGNGNSDNSQGDIWIGTDQMGQPFAAGTFNFVAMMHEIGHALGLAHPFEGKIIPAGYDNERYTIMSYTSPDNVWLYNPATGDSDYLVRTPMVYDIAAVQRLYGANMSYHSGADAYVYKHDQPFFATIWDGGGKDTIDIRDFTKGCTIDLEPGSYSTLGFSNTTLDQNLGIAFGCTIENVMGGAGADTITGNSATNSLKGYAGTDTIHGAGGNDVLTGGSGTDSLFGDAGNDTFLAGADPGDDQLNGGDGIDTASFASAKAAVTVDLGAGNAHGLATGDVSRTGSDTLSGIEGVIGSAFDDQITGSANADVLDGAAGNDAMNGLGGNDMLVGGPGNDTLNGGDGLDTASYAKASAAVAISLTIVGAQATGGAGSDTLIGIENLTGSTYADTLTGNASANVLNGGGGADRLAGGGGNDTYYVENPGDIVNEQSNQGTDTVMATISWTLTDNLETLILTGTAATNGTGNALGNTLKGNGAANVLAGAAGTDRLYGGAGNDTLNGGAARDVMNGGTGADKFVFAVGDFGGMSSTTADEIVDFHHSETDRIDLFALDANTTNGAGNDAFAFIGTAAFGSHAGELRYQVTGGIGFVQGDTNGDGTADFWIRLDGAPAVVAGDFVL